MERSDKEVTDSSWITTVLQEAQYCHIGFCNMDQPYVIPMNFLFFEGHLILHSALDGEKIRFLKRNPKVSFSAEVGVELLVSDAPCGYSMRFRSVCGTGIARCVEEPEEKGRLLRIFAMKFISGPLPVFPPDLLAQVMVIDVTITRLSGKKSGYLLS